MHFQLQPVFFLSKIFIRLLKRSKSFIRTGIQHMFGMCVFVLRFAFVLYAFAQAIEQTLFDSAVVELLSGMFLWFKQISHTFNYSTNNSHSLPIPLSRTIYDCNLCHLQH